MKCLLMMTKDDQVIEVESPSNTRDNSEVEVREREHTRDELSRCLDWKPSQT